MGAGREEKRAKRGRNAPEKLRRVAALMVMTTRRSPRRSAYSSIRTAARRLTGRRSQSGKGFGLKARSRARAALVLVSIVMLDIITWKQGERERVLPPLLGNKKKGKRPAS